VSLVDADGARGLLDVVFVGLDADVELGRQVGRDEVLGHQRFVTLAPDREPDGRQRHGRRPVQHGDNPAGATDEHVGRVAANAHDRLGRGGSLQKARHRPHEYQRERRDGSDQRERHLPDLDTAQ